MKRTGRRRGEAMTGEALRRLRRRLGLTQLQLAERLGTRANTVYRWEAGLVGIGEVQARLLRFLAAQSRSALSSTHPKTRTPGSRRS